MRKPKTKNLKQKKNLIPSVLVYEKSMDRWKDGWTLTNNSATTFINTSFIAVSRAWGISLLQTT